MEHGMNTVTLRIASREDVTRRALAAFRGEVQGAFISFASTDLLWRTLTRKRWDVLRAMTGQGPLAIRDPEKLPHPIHSPRARCQSAIDSSG